MKILHVSSAKSWRGGEQQISYLVNGLKKLDVEQWLLCPENAPLGDRLTDQLSVNTFKKRSSLSFSAARKIRNICLKNDIEIIQLHDSHAHTAGVLAQSLFGLRVPMILTRRVLFSASKSILSIWKYNHASIKKIVCVSTAVKNVMADVIQNKGTIAVINSSIDIEKFKNVKKGKLRKLLNLNSASPIIGSIGALDVDKNFSLYLDTAKEISKHLPETHYVIIGKDEGQQRMLQIKAEQLRLTDRLHFLGFRKNISSLLVDFDLFLSTSKSEGLGSSVLDAMASNVPVVVTDSGGVKDIVQNSVNGFIAADAHELAKRSIEILENQELRKNLCASAEESVSRFGTQDMALSYHNLYREIILT